LSTIVSLVEVLSYDSTPPLLLPIVVGTI
jgi:hypothetical protein